MEKYEATLRELKTKIRNPQAAGELRQKLRETRTTRKKYDPDAFLDFVKDNPAFRNLPVTEDED
ncbi:MAG: hypothetical protein JWL77_3596 [Chthonomonadaceae bacterium]|nr:hypothetical protein [Chthonomonadaceae bacterium]